MDFKSFLLNESKIKLDSKELDCFLKDLTESVNESNVVDKLVKLINYIADKLHPGDKEKIENALAKIL